MIERRAYAKINLSLDVLRRREDGYHEVKMIMQTIGIYDTLTFEEVNEFPPSDDTYSFCDGKIMLKILNVASKADIGPMEKNLIYRASKLIYDKYSIDKKAIITLDKNIPVAAGMAGGSTDAAAVFHGLNELFDLNMSIKDMCELGVKIGADVPYCIMGGTALSEGIGEILTKIPTPPACYILIAKPDISVSTKFVYENLHANELKVHPDVDSMIEAITDQDLLKMAELLGNVLETVTTKEYPIIDSIKKAMIDNGALNSLMSGSGPTVFGLFEDKKKAEEAFLEIRNNNLAKEIFITEFVN